MAAIWSEALVEIPINIGQLIVGLIVSAPLVKVIMERLPGVVERFG